MIKRIINYSRRMLWSSEKYARFLGVKIGENCSIDTHFFGSEPYLIEIGNHVQITSDVRFFNHGGSWVFREKYPKMDVFGKIKIGNNVYMGNCSMILPGVTIGDNVIIGAGSIVTKSIPSGKIVAGNPAKIIGEIDNLEIKMISFNLNSKDHSYLQKKNFLLRLDDKLFLKK